MDDENPNEQIQSERRVVVYMPETLVAELDRRAALAPDEGWSRSKLIRAALREYFRRHVSK